MKYSRTSEILELADLIDKLNVEIVTIENILAQDISGIYQEEYTELVNEQRSLCEKLDEAVRKKESLEIARDNYEYERSRI